MKASRRDAYHLLLLALGLLLAHSLLQTRHWLHVIDTLSDPLPVTPHLNFLLRLSIDTFFIAAGYFALADHDGSTVIRWWRWSWFALAIAGVALAVIEAEGEIWRILELAAGGMLGLATIWIMLHIREWTVIPSVWVAGMGLHGVSGMLHALSDNEELARLDLHVAMTMAAAALMFWLMHRYSRITPLWSVLGLQVVTGWLVTAGVILSFDLDALPGFLRWLAAGFVALAYVIFAAHCYRALSDRDESQTLAAHWHALAVTLLLIVTGFGGALRIFPPAASDLAGTWLAHLPETGAGLAMVALGLGLLNQIMAELRRENRRVTGLLPFWTISGGWLLGVLAMAAMGVVQVFYGRIGYLETTTDLLPLIRYYVAGQIITLIGLIVYAMGVYARRLRLNQGDKQ